MKARLHAPRLQTALARWWIAGYPSGAVSPYFRVKTLGTARAGRPVKARVSTVGPRPGSAMAARCTADAPLSSLRSSAVPTRTASVCQRTLLICQTPIAPAMATTAVAANRAG